MDDAIEPDQQNVNNNANIINENAAMDINVADKNNPKDKTDITSENGVAENIKIELGEKSPIPKHAADPGLKISDSLDEALMGYISLDKIEEMNEYLLDCTSSYGDGTSNSFNTSCQ